MNDLHIPKNITFIVTKDCQLACKYCYLVGKNRNEKMNFDIAQKAIDYFTNDPNMFRNDGLIIDFIGGEPFLEIELIDRICDYIKIKLYKERHKWFDNYIISITTNGLLYSSQKVQQFIEKNRNHISITISLDGVREKHDLQRVYPNGKGSYNDVIKSIPLWIKQFKDTSTKVTIGSDDIPFIAKSVLHIWDLGIKNIFMNVVNEDIWKADDDILFENELIKLADSIIDNQLYDEYSCSIFDESIGKKIDSTDNRNWCGTGEMIAVDPKGNFYPCVRFVDYSLSNKKDRKIGNIEDGIKDNLLRPFLTLDRTTQSKQECIDCEVAFGCAWCQGENYDAAETNTIFQRSTAICKMHKARVRANNYYWNKLYRHLEKEKTEVKQKTSINCDRVC